MLIPTKEMVFAERVRAHAKDVPHSFARLVAMEADVRTRIQAELQERGIEMIDPLPALRATLRAVDGSRAPINLYPETWDGHPAAAGYKAVADAVAAAIRRPPA